LEFDVKKTPEGQLVEKPLLEQLWNMKYDYKTQRQLNKERDKTSEVIIYKRLRPALKKINPHLSDVQINQAIEQIHEEEFEHSLSRIDTNETIYGKLTGLSTSRFTPIQVDSEDPSKEFEDVKIFDFEHPLENDFLVTNQFELFGFKEYIYPDIVIFVNGIPLVVIECKRKDLPDPIEEAVEKNFAKYQLPKKGWDKLFFYNFFMVATCGIVAKHGTIGANVNHFAPWTESYPLEKEEVAAKCTIEPRQQEFLVAGMLSKKHLLKLLKNYVIFDVENEKKIKKIAKHQQFRAVEKAVIRAGLPGKKGGVIWHTQGSGKSLSMVWFSTQLLQEFGTPPIIIVTDRKQLDRQITDTFTNAGYPSPKQIKKSNQLEEFLANPEGKTRMTTIHKFSEVKSKINTNEKIFVLVDEAHRTQYKDHAIAMNNVLGKNAMKFGFTGTPIEKNNKNTFEEFGDPIDEYNSEESKADGATIPIDYVGLMPNLEVADEKDLKEIVKRAFSDLDEKTIAELQKKCITREKIAETPSRIKKIAWKIVKHFSENVQDKGFKAMIIAPNRDAAKLYKDYIDEFKGPKSEIIMTVTKGEKGGKFDDYRKTEKEIETETESFKEESDPTKILIVVDMLLTGFDAPIVQVMYLDHGLKDHTLLQAIARVNRPYNKAKTRGLIVDFWGTTRDIQKALAMFREKDVAGILIPFAKRLEILKENHNKLLETIKGIDINDDNQVQKKFDSEFEREKLKFDFREFAKALNNVMPNVEANPYLKDVKEIGTAIRALQTFIDRDKMSIKPYAPMVQKLIEDHIRTKGISELIDPIEITYSNFKAYAKTLTDPRARAALMKNHAIMVIKEGIPNNPTYYGNLYEKLQKLIEEEEKRRNQDADYFASEDEFDEFIKRALAEKEERQKVFGGYEATQFEFAIYGEINQIQKDAQKVKKSVITIYEKIQPEMISGWKEKIESKGKIEEIIYDTLKENGISEDKVDKLKDKLFTLAINRL
jgi:type I restriction enzyme, R subunit